jgi:hypothetical protein
VGLTRKEKKEKERREEWADWRFVPRRILKLKYLFYFLDLILGLNLF